MENTVTIKLKDLVEVSNKDAFLDKIKKLTKGTKVSFYGQTPQHLDKWQTFYFQEMMKTVEGMKAILSKTKEPKIDIRLATSNKYVYGFGKIKPINASGSRPNAYTMMGITDMKVG